MSVAKNESILQGQKIGEVVSDPSSNFGLMHFEVRDGMESIDPLKILAQTINLKGT